MKDGGDAFGVLGWGLRKYAWVVAAFVIALGVVVPGLLDRVPDEYEAQAQVGPTEALNLPNLDPLPRLGDSIFHNGVVAEAVRQSVDPPLPRTARVIPERVELVAAQDNIVFTVIGRGPTPVAAERVANAAAATFTQELNKYSASVGSFAIQRLATPPSQPVPKVGGTTSIGVGILAGLTAGIGTVALLLVWRRPVVDVVSVQQTTGSPVFGRVQLTSTRQGIRGLPQLCRRVASGTTDTLLLAGPRNTRRDRRLLVSELSRLLGWNRRVICLDAQDTVNRSQQDQESGDTPDRQQLVIIDGPTQFDLATRSDTSLTLLVVREGIAHSALRRQAELHLDGGAVGVVLVHRPRWDVRSWWKPRHRSDRSAEPRSPRRWRAEDNQVASSDDSAWSRLR